MARLHGLRRNIQEPWPLLGVCCRLYEREGEPAISPISSRNTIRERKETIMTRSSIAKTFAIGAVAALALGLAPTAKAQRKECSAATLEGSFARSDTGFVITPPAIAGPLTGVVLVTFDGNGGFTSTG